ncbi:MAG: sialidase family protein [Vicinamibacterales bacterium]
MVMVFPPRRSGRSACCLGLTLAALIAIATPAAAQPSQTVRAKATDDRMSPMGQLAARAREVVAERAAAALAGRDNAAGRLDAGIEASDDKEDDDLCLNDPRCPAGLREGPSGGQAELSIAIDHTRQFVVVGFNDTRGFALNPTSVSGFMYSSDGGRTFTDGGSLPITAPTESIGTTIFPQVFGDPDVKHLGGCTFVYSSILVRKFSATTAVQTMGVHRSTDCGKTWQGPYEVVPATNPNGLTVGAAPADAADKEFIDVDPDTGRLIMTWSNFTATAPGGVEIRSAFSIDGGLTWPVDNGRIISRVAADGQSSIPRFAAGSADVYAAWERFPSPGVFGGFGNTIAFARSLDNGETWQPPIELSPEFITMDQVLGNDRINNSPALAVDRTGGARDGHIYAVYASNNGLDGADVVFQRSIDRGTTFSAPVAVNSRPGDDRAQWFPTITVDSLTGRVSIFFYDQGVDTSGHRTETSYVFSDNGGSTWSAPRPLTERPFKAGHGNDTSQPNLGDYNQMVAAGGQVWAAYSLPSPPPEGFADGQPSTALTVPDAVVRIVPLFEHLTPYATVAVRGAATAVTGGNAFADPGEAIGVHLPLFNYVTNPISARPVRFPVGILGTSTPGVEVTWAITVYPNVLPGQTANGFLPFAIRLAPTFVAGTPIELELLVISLDGVTRLHHTLFTGTPVKTTLLEENFDAVATGALPLGWQTAHGGGANIVPWTTSNTFCGTSNGAFHQNANDNPMGSPVRWERLFSPAFNVPNAADYVEVEFDVCYDTEDEPNFDVLAYDGFFLRVADLTPGQTLRSVLVEAFEQEFTTGDIQHYPRHLPRSGNQAYFQDMSAWAGRSNGVKHVRLRLPGMQGRNAQLRFEYTQDPSLDCKAVRPLSPACGVFVDNITVRSVVSQTSVTGTR